MSEGRLRGTHLVIVPLSGRRASLKRFAEGLGRFTAIDLDCSLQQAVEGAELEAEGRLEGGGIVEVVSDIYSLGRVPCLVVNSLNTVQAMARVASRGKEWNRKYFRYLVALTTACRARSELTFFLLTFGRFDELRGLKDKKWFRPYGSLVDAIWILGESGLMPLT